MIKNTVKDVAKIFSKSKTTPILLIKSTVIPGTVRNVILPIFEKYSSKKVGKDFGLISNPEFLQEGKAIENTKHPHAIILGGYKTKFFTYLELFLSSRI